MRYRAAQVPLGELQLDAEQRLLFVPAAGDSKSVTSPAVVITNPSEHFNPPNGPQDGLDPLTNQFAYFNVPGWYDDTCGGAIDATVTLTDGSVLSTRNDVGTPSESRNPARGAWVVVAPPKYSPWMYHVVSILDRRGARVLRPSAARKMELEALDGGEGSGDLHGSTSGKLWGTRRESSRPTAARIEVEPGPFRETIGERDAKVLPRQGKERPVHA